MLKRLYVRFLSWFRVNRKGAMEGYANGASLSSLSMSEIRLKKED